MSAQTVDSPAQLHNESFFSRLTDFIDARLNPMLVKDVRGWLRSRAFLLLFFSGLLIGQVATVLFIISSSGEHSMGRFMFTCITCGLAVICGSFVPYMTYNKMMNEMKSKASELAMASYITPAILINGKLQSSIAAALLFFTAVAPSLAIAYLLGGVDILTAAVIVAMVAIGNIISTLLLMFLAGFGSPMLGRILSLGWFFFAAIGLPVIIYIFMEETARSNYIYTGECWIITSFIVLASLPLLYFFHSLAVAYLSPTHFNRDSHPRTVLTLTAVFAFTFFWVMGFLIKEIDTPREVYDYFAIYGLAASCIFSICLFFILGTPLYPSRRICSNWPRSNLWATFMYPGIDRLNAYILLHYTMFFTITMIGTLSNRVHVNIFPLAVLDMFSFFVVGSLTYNIIGDWCERRGITTNLIYTTLASNILWLIIILTIYISLSVLPNFHEQEVLLFSPVTHFSYVTSHSSIPEIGYILPSCMGILGMIMYITSIVRAWQDGISQRRFTQKLKWLRKNNPSMQRILNPASATPVTEIVGKNEPDCYSDNDGKASNESKA